MFPADGTNSKLRISKRYEIQRTGRNMYSEVTQHAAFGAGIFSHPLLGLRWDVLRNKVDPPADWFFQSSFFLEPRSVSMLVS